MFCMSDDSSKSLYRHYRLLLGLGAPWEVSDVDLRVGESRVTVSVDWPKGRKPCCPDCGASCDIHDHAPQRRWRHLDTMQFETVIVSRTPRVDCSKCGVKTIGIPWAEPRSRFTRLFEALAVETIGACRSLKQAGALLSLSYDQLQRIMDRAVQRGMRRRERAPARRVGVDEKSYGRGHRYASVMTDLDGSRVLEVVANRDGEAARALFESLGPNAGQIHAVAMDMWPAFMRAAAAKAPEAVVVHDRFHVSKHLNEAMDSVRKPENRELSREGKDYLKGTKYLFLRSSESWSEDHREMFQIVKDLSLKVAKAWAAKDAFSEFWTFRDRGQALAFFNNWRRWVGRLKLAPLTRASDMLKRHIDGLLNYSMYPITNAASEGFNSKIQSLISNARGYRRFENLRTAILFHCGKLDMCPLKTQ
jgi:transposase